MQPLDSFLSAIGLTNDFVRQQLAENGYDDDTFFQGLKENDLRDMGFLDLMDGRAIVRKSVIRLTRMLFFFVRLTSLLADGRLLDASSGGKLKLQRPVVPALIPTTLKDWLVYLHLEQYGNNLQLLGYGDRDLVLLENVSDAEIKALGITKRAHVQKLKLGIKKLQELLFQGRQPEGG